MQVARGTMQKKSFEKGVEINGQIYYKKSEPHKASVTGDTVGDPFKDTSGPSMNILIKLMSIVSLVIAPTLAQVYHTRADQSNNHKGQKMEMKITAIANHENPEKVEVTLNGKSAGESIEALVAALQKIE